MIAFVLARAHARIGLVGLHELREHEEVDPKHLEELRDEIRADGILKRPIVVDRRNHVILDGEHRFNALKQLGCSRIPSVLVDYRSPLIQVKAWRREERVTKRDVVEAGLTGRKLPFKSSKHLIRVESGLRHISVLQKRVDVPLDQLRG